MTPSLPHPDDTLDALLGAINRRDLDAALSLYEPDAVFVAEPGKVVRGHAAIRAELAALFDLAPCLQRLRHLTLPSESGLCLSHSEWVMKGTGPDGQPIEMRGASTDVTREQPDGRWKILFDNPFGAEAMPEGPTS